jgi:glycosyltransferase involved in cell wall biosynthesis
VIKADYFLDPENKKQQCIQLINEFGLTNVKLIWGELTTVQLFELYNFADVYVTATRAEGWGLPIIEAAASGLPIIAPFYSGQKEYLEYIESTFLKTNYILSKIDDPEFMHFWPNEGGNYGNWAKSEIISLEENFIQLKNNVSVYENLTLKNALIIQSQFNWGISVSLALQSLSKNNIIFCR